MPTSKIPKRPGAEAVSQATRAKRRRADQYGPQAERCRSRPCVVGSHNLWNAREIECSGPIEVHHEPSRGAGGTDRDTIPLCRKHHGERHALGKLTFETRYGVDLLDLVGAMRRAL